MPPLTQFVAAAAAWLTASLCAGLAAWLAWHHPLSPAVVLLLCTLVAVVTGLWPGRWPLWLFPALPLIGLMPWSGWVVVEELDLLVLSVAAGGHLRLALGTQLSRTSGRVPNGAWLLLLPLLLAVVLGLWRALDGVGDQGLTWWQADREPLNSLRLAKSLFEVLVLLPLARVAWRADQAQASARLVQGLVWALLFVGLGALWDSIVLAGAPAALVAHRPSLLFWEAQRGGGALAAVLALTLPFAAAALAQAGTQRAAAVPASALLLGVLACVRTGSPVDLLACALGLCLWWWLQVRQPGRSARGQLPAAVGGALVLVLAAWLAPAAGPFGWLAMLGAIALMLPLQGLRSRLAAGPLVWSLGGGAVLACALSALAWAVPLAAPPIYALAWLLGVSMLAWVWARGQPVGVMWALVATGAVLGGVVAVSVLAGGQAAGLRAAAASLVLGVGFCMVVLRQRISWPDDLGWQSKMLVGLAAFAMLGNWLGAVPLASRLDAAEASMSQRAAHWHASLDLLQTPADWALGKGVGSFPAQHAAAAPAGEQGGDIRWLPDEDGGQAQLSSGSQPVSPQGGGYQLVQRVGTPQAAAGGDAPVAVLRLLARSNDKNVSLHASLCAAVCATSSATLSLPPRPGQWQTLQLPLKNPAPGADPGWAPRPVVFALGVQPGNLRVQVDQLSLIDGQGIELLDNGGFDAGLARWTTAAEPPYNAWHVQNAAVHLLFEQGLLGLVAWLAALGVALWRLAAGAARQRSLAPPLAAALIGAALLGMQDSLFDMPRVAFLGTCLLAVALCIADHGQHRRRRGHKTRA